jgi:dienelactone hydrolase
MKKIQFSVFGILLIIASCNSSSSSTTMETPQTSIKEENITYSLDSITMHGFVAYNKATVAKRPVVLIVHEWWGLTDYVKNRAKQLAALGYLAIAVDMYGNGTIADNPSMAGKLAAPFYQNPQMAKGRFDAALAKIKTYPIADTTRIAGIGYCFGGGVVLNVARLGENLKGVVSFHGNLVGVPADKKLLKADVLICHGDADQFVKKEDVEKFKKEMDDIGAPYTFKSYPGATHAFTNPASTETGKKFNMPIAYNAAADTASFNEMKLFFTKIFK